MKKHLALTLAFLLPALISLVLLCSSCKNEAGRPVILESKKLNKKEGPDCDKGDDYKNKCLAVDLSYPIVKDGQTALQKAVEAWCLQFLNSSLNPSMTIEEVSELPLDSSLQIFFANYRETLADTNVNEGPNYFTLEVKDTVLLNDGKHLTLKLDAYTYMGGAHPNAYSGVATFEANTGKMLKLDDLVSDLKKLESLALEKFKQVKAEAFKEGFDFSPDWPFALAANAGLTDKGIYFCYNPYEVAPYALGYTEFVLTFEELKELKK